MTTTLRAALSVLMLAGFYVLALALIGLLAWGSWAAFQNDQATAGGKLGILAVVVAVSIVVALWRVSRARPEPETGPTLSESDAPALWATVRELAAVADTRIPDVIRLEPVVNAYVSEETRLLGLVGGRRTLGLGIPLVQVLDVGQLRSVLAHELGHYSRSHTRLGPLTYRGRQAIGATLEQLSGNVVGWFLGLYGKLYVIVAAAVNRRQELEADELSVKVAGRATAQSALREIPLADAAWTFYLNAYVEDAWESGFAPTPQGFFGGFGQLLAGRAGELEAMRADAPPAEQSRWDSHPSIAARVAAMEHMPDTAPTRDTRTATALIEGFEAHAAAVAQHSFPLADRTQLEWSALTATSLSVTQQRVADSVYRAAARVAGTQRGNLGTVLDLVASGRGPALGKELGTASLAGPLEVVLGVALVTAGAASWQHSWSGPAKVVDASGRPFDVDGLVALAGDPATAPTARERLAGLGVDVEAAAQVSAKATAHGGEIVGGLASVKVDGSKQDVLVLDNGVILVPTPKRDEHGKNRLIGIAQSGSVVQLATYHRFVPFEDLASAEVHKSTPARVTLTFRDGTTLSLQETWAGETLTKDSGATLLAVVQAYVSTSDELGSDVG